MIPAELTELKQWVCWRTETRDNKPTKLPLNPANGQLASSTDRSTWTTYEEASKAHEDGLGDGLGFVFSASDPFCGIDIDDCLDPKNGIIETTARAIIKRLNSYTEVSPSGTGLHIIVKATLPPGGNRKDRVEMYDAGRYFACTGNCINGSKGVQERQEELSKLHAFLFPPKAPAPSRVSPQVNMSLTDADIVEKAMSAKNGDNFTRLWKGDTGGYRSQSEADMSMANKLAFWCGCDHTQMDSLFRSSGLMRPKWDKKHGDKTYGEKTIAKAIESCRETYSPPVKRPQAVATSNPRQFIDKNTFIPKRLADEILSQYRFKFAGGTLWVYIDGVYRPTGEDLVRQESHRLLADERRDNRVLETLHYISDGSIFDMPKTNPWVINLANGRLNWRSGELEPHDSNVFEITQIPHRFDPSATCPLFEEFLSTTVDDDVVPLIEEMMGYCLIADTRYEKAFGLVGDGANGKGVLLDTLVELLGRENISNLSLQTIEENRFAAAELVGKLANIHTDLDARALRSSSMFKVLVSGDRLTVEKKYGQPFSFENRARLIFSANQFPTSYDKSFALYRRLVFIRFEKTFIGPDADKFLRMKLQDELPGILNHALRGLQRLFTQDDFTTPAVVAQALEEYKRENDSVAAFVADCVEVVEGGYIEKPLFKERYFAWCETQGIRHPANERTVKSSLTLCVPTLGEGRVGDYGARTWTGIELIR